MLEGFAPIDQQQPVTVVGNDGRWVRAPPDGRRPGPVPDPHDVRRRTGRLGPDPVSDAGREAADRERFRAILDSFERTDLQNVWALGPGDCFESLQLVPPDRAGSSSVFIGPLDGFAAVDWCTHTGEVIATVASADSDCDDAFSTYVGQPLAESALALLEFVPLSASDLPAGVASLCVVADPAGSSTGTAEGSRR